MRIACFKVNPADRASRSGLTTAEPPASPRVPQSDGAGVIDAVGDGVDPGRVGERVWIWHGQWQRVLGTPARFIALPLPTLIRPHSRVVVDGMNEAAASLPAL